MLTRLCKTLLTADYMNDRIEIVESYRRQAWAAVSKPYGVMNVL
jgi:hypothetical protein